MVCEWVNGEYTWHAEMTTWCVGSIVLFSAHHGGIIRGGFGFLKSYGIFRIEA